MIDVALLSPVNPFEPLDGHRMAIASDVNAVLDNGLSLGVATFLYRQQQPVATTKCDCRYFRVAAGSFATRLLRGLATTIPPSSERLYTRQSIAGIRHALSQWQPRFVIIDDVSMSGYIPHVRELVPHAKVILRTHNVMHDVRGEQLARTRGIARIPVGLDTGRYRKFERDAVRNADAHWAITQTDARRITELTGCPSQFLSLSISIEPYMTVSTTEGIQNHFVHVGTLDFRRQADLENFLQQSWPRVRAADQAAQLTLAGSMIGKGIDAPGVTYTGPVASDTEVYRRGRFALNFQQSTGGIKLKTLTSLAAGRILVSTRRGVEGVPIESGLHYWDMEEFLSGKISDRLQDTEALLRMADEGRAWVAANHSRASVAEQFRQLMDEVGSGRVSS